MSSNTSLLPCLLSWLRTSTLMLYALDDRNDTIPRNEEMLGSAGQHSARACQGTEIIQVKMDGHPRHLFEIPGFGRYSKIYILMIRELPA